MNVMGVMGLLLSISGWTTAAAAAQGDVSPLWHQLPPVRRQRQIISADPASSVDDNQPDPDREEDFGYAENGADDDFVEQHVVARAAEALARSGPHQAKVDALVKNIRKKSGSVSPALSQTSDNSFNLVAVAPACDVDPVTVDELNGVTGFTKKPPSRASSSDISTTASMLGMAGGLVSTAGGIASIGITMTVASATGPIGIMAVGAALGVGSILLGMSGDDPEPSLTEHDVGRIADAMIEENNGRVAEQINRATQAVVNCVSQSISWLKSELDKEIGTLKDQIFLKTYKDKMRDTGTILANYRYQDHPISIGGMLSAGRVECSKIGQLTQDVRGNSSNLKYAIVLLPTVKAWMDYCNGLTIAALYARGRFAQRGDNVEVMEDERSMTFSAMGTITVFRDFFELVRNRTTTDTTNSRMLDVYVLMCRNLRRTFDEMTKHAERGLPFPKMAPYGTVPSWRMAVEPGGFTCMECTPKLIHKGWKESPRRRRFPQPPWGGSYSFGGYSWSLLETTLVGSSYMYGYGSVLETNVSAALHSNEAETFEYYLGDQAYARRRRVPSTTKQALESSCSHCVWDGNYFGEEAYGCEWMKTWEARWGLNGTSYNGKRTSLDNMYYVYNACDRLGMIMRENDWPYNFDT